MITKTGFILTSHWNDTRDGLELSYYCSDNESPFLIKFTQQKIVFFIPRKAIFDPINVKFERKAGKLKSFSHDEVDTIYLNQYKDLSEVKAYCEKNGIRTYELDILPPERFLMERFINGNIEIQGEQRVDDGFKTFVNPQIRSSKGNVSLSSLSLDIETGSNGDLYSIAMSYEGHRSLKNIVLMMSDENKKINDELIFYSTEQSLLKEFIHIFNDWDPDLILGWHVVGFDLMFLEKKLLKYNIPFSIGRRNKKIKLDERKGVGFFANITGRLVLDGPPVLRSAFYQFKNFKLDTVASEVLKTGKDIASDAGKVTEIERRFREDKVALAKYNLLDCTLVTDIFKKLNIFDLIINRVQISGLLIDRLAVSTAAFDHHFLPLLHRKGYVAPNRIDIIREDASVGGLVLEPKAGLHSDVAIFDFKSLYPSIIKSFNIDPYSNIMSDTETIRTPEGFEFSRTEHILPGIISTLLGKREMAKFNHDNSLSQAIKILMNSFYGVMGSSRCRFYHADLPTAITTTGHWILRSAISFFENHGHKIIYGDTDSIFIQLNEKQAKDSSYCDNLANEVDIYLQKLLKDEYKITSFLECEYEKTFDKVFFSMSRGSDSAAKKRYAGYTDHEIEFKGMETVRSDWTQLAKNFQKQIYQMFFQGEELDLFIKEYIKRLESGEFDDLLVYTKRLSKAPEEYVKNVPIHVKAALKVDHKGPYRLKEVSYVITPTGPEPIQSNSDKFDYQHYIEKQLKPIANDILLTQDKSFDSIYIGKQLELF
jgi:DNA polymerase-2